MVNYWLAKHDKVSIELKPGWIWRNTDISKKPPNYLKVQKGDKFVLYAHKTSEDRDQQLCSEVYGFYRVASPVEERSVARYNYWVIVGEPILAEGWVTAPHPSRFYLEKKFNQQSLVRLLEADFKRFFEYYSKYMNARWDIFEREPENEQEVIALFTRFMHKLGYVGYERLGTPTPDAVLTSSSGRKVRVEFEYSSRGLRTHNLRALRGTRCICWVDDLPPSSKYSKNLQIIPIKQRIFDILNPHAV